MNVDVQFLAWLALIASGISNALTVWNFAQSPSRKNAEAIKAVADSLQALIDKIDKRLGSTERAVGTLQVQFQHMPDQQALHHLEMSLEKTHGQIATLNAKLEPVEHLSKRLQEFMIEMAERSRGDRE